MVFGVTGANAVDLPEPFDVLQGDGRLSSGLPLGVQFLDASQVDDAVEQHRGMTGGEDEAVAVHPAGIGGIIIHEVLVEVVDHRGERHRGTRVARVGGLHGIHGQGAHGGDGLERRILGGFGRKADVAHEKSSSTSKLGPEPARTR